MKKIRDFSLIESASEVRALTSTVRQDILDMVQALGETTIPELAAHLSRSANSLYYHVRALERAGLLRRVGTKSRKRHNEAVYSARNPAKPLAISYRSLRESSVSALREVVSAMLQTSKREFNSAIVAPGCNMDGDRRELWPSRTVGWLSPEDIATVNTLLKEVSRVVAAHRTSPSDKLFALQFMLAPIVGRSKRARSGNGSGPTRSKKRSRAKHAAVSRKQARPSDV